MNGTDIHDAWSKTLKDKDSFIGTTQGALLKAVAEMKDTESALHYLENRYWK